MSSTRLTPAISLLAAVSLASSLLAQTPVIQWTGANGTFWTDEGNWSPAGAPRTNGRFSLGLVVNAASELVYDSTLGASVYGGVNRPALLIGAGGGSVREAGIFKITGGSFSGEGASGAEAIDRIGELGGHLIVDGGTYVSSPLGLALGEGGKGEASLIVQSGSARIASILIESPLASVALNGGMLELGRLRVKVPEAGDSRAVVKFNGTRVRAKNDEPDFLGLSREHGRLEIGAGGLVLDTSGRKVGVSNPLKHSSDPADAGRDGGVTKEGEGALTLAAVNDFTGDIIINRGTLRAGFTRNIPNPNQTALGNTQLAQRKIYVNEGGWLDFVAGDSMGSAGSRVKTPIEVARGGLVTNSFRTHTRLGPLVLNGGTLRAEGGPREIYQAYSLDQSVTVGGSSASSMVSNFASNSGIHLSLATEFSVADATQSPAADLVVDATLVNCNGIEGGLSSPAALIKTGPGTLRLAAANQHTGRTTIQAGVLELAHAAALAASPVDVAPGARLVCVGKNQTYTLGGIVNQRGQPQTIDAADNTLAFADDAVALFVFSGPPSDKAMLDVNVGRLKFGGELTVRFARALPPGNHLFKLFRANSLAGSFRQFNIAGAYSAQGAQTASASGAEFAFDATTGDLIARIR
jgi:autotransporter-associated beta strand protein